MNPFTKIYTLISTDRLCNLIKYSVFTEAVQGDIAEFGVYKGGSLEVLAKYNPTSKIYGIDSFEGLPDPSEKDVHKKGDFGDVSFEHIEAYFKSHYWNVELHKGFSPNVFEKIKDKLFKFVHIDVDLYSSVTDGLTFFVPRMTEGGIIILDDYKKFESTPGCELAINDFFAATEVKHRQELTYFTYENSEHHGQYLIQR